MYEPGTLVADKYRIERPLGRGGMGIVVGATHLELRISVALKFLAEKYTQQPQIVERFLREARSAARLHSKHVCRVTDVGRHYDGRTADGVPFIVMEMLAGQDLSRVLRADGKLAPGVAARHILEACDALAEAHAAGIVHRDLKPGNLFLAQQRDGSAVIKVLDFGVAKVARAAEHDLSITSNEAVMGSPSYMSPEQLRSARAADARSDIWSLGIILYQLVAGRTPFGGGSVPDLAIRAATEPMPPLDAPPAYCAIVERCLEKQPELRFQSARELAAALAPLAAAPSELRVGTTGPLPLPMAASPGATAPAMPRHRAHDTHADDGFAREPELLDDHPSIVAGTLADAGGSHASTATAAPAITANASAPSVIASDSFARDAEMARAAMPTVPLQIPPTRPVRMAAARPNRRLAWSITLALAISIGIIGAVVLSSRGDGHGGDHSSPGAKP